MACCTWEFVNVAPRDASSSILGVLANSSPYAPIDGLRSSTAMNIIFFFEYVSNVRKKKVK